MMESSSWLLCVVVWYAGIYMIRFINLPHGEKPISKRRESFQLQKAGLFDCGYQKHWAVVLNEERLKRYSSGAQVFALRFVNVRTGHLDSKSVHRTKSQIPDPLMC